MRRPRPRPRPARAAAAVALGLTSAALAGCGGAEAPPPPEVGLPGPEASVALPPRTAALLAVDLRAPAATRRRAIELALRLQPALDAAGDDEDAEGDPLVAGLLQRRGEVRRWSTGQLAFALSPGRSGTGSAYVLAARDARAAEATIRRVVPRMRRTPLPPGGVRLTGPRSHAVVLPGAVAFGERRAVDAIAAHHRSGRPSLAATAAYGRAMTGVGGADAVILRPPTAGAGPGGTTVAARTDVRLLDGGMRASLRPLGADGSRRPVPALGGALTGAPGRDAVAAGTTSSLGVLARALAAAGGGAGAGGGALQPVVRLAEELRGVSVRTLATADGLRTDVALAAPDAASAGQLGALLRGAAQDQAGALRARGLRDVAVVVQDERILLQARTPYAGARPAGPVPPEVLARAQATTGARLQAALLPAAAADALGPLLGAGPGSRELARAVESVGVALPGGTVEVGLRYRGPVPAPRGAGGLGGLIPAVAPAPPDRRTRG